jgi:type III secretion protein C
MKKIILTLLLITNITFAVDDIPPIVAVTSKTNTDNNKGKYNYFFHGESLNSAIKKFAVQNGMDLVISNDLTQMQRSVSGRFSFTQLNQFLDNLSSQYGFDWFIYSGTLYITSQKNMSETVEVSPEDIGNLKNNLQQMGLLNSKFGYTELSAENKIIITGPRIYVDLLVNQIKSLNIMPTNQQFAVFRLKYASANDIQLYFNNQQIIIPGVATILQGILQNNQPTNSNSRVDAQVSEPIKNQITQILGKQNSSAPVAGANSNRGMVSSPLIEADSRLNTIIIRDKAVNLKIYKNLIDLLDVPSPLIQIEVLIVHLDQEKISQAGINWWASGLGVGAGYGKANLANGVSNNLSVSYGQVNPGQLLVTNMGKFISSLQFLEANNLAQAVGKPSMVTTDNLPAIMNINENLYMGQNSAGNSINNTPQNYNYNFNQVQITQALQVIPHVIYDKIDNKIKLSITLQDGSVNEDNNAVIPNTTQSSINSQAVINEGQSVLIAGYTRNEKQNLENKVPVLGDIPFLGWFFKNQSVVNHKITTLYLVTPKVIDAKDMQKLDDYIMVGGNKINDIKPEYQPNSNK